MTDSMEAAVSTLRWIPDQDDAESVDDLFAKGVRFRMERMSNTHYWMAIFLDDGTEHHFDITSKRKIRAFARQPAPALDALHAPRESGEVK